MAIWRYRVAMLVCLLLVGPARALGGQADDIPADSGVRRGLAVHVGCGDGHLTAELAGGSVLVQGLAADTTNAAEAREHIRSRGLQRSVTVEHWTGPALPYVDNTVNLLVVSGEAPGLTREEILRVLAPRGVAIVGGRKLVKPWPDELDEWTHWLHGAGNNAVSKDKAVGISRRLQWVGGPLWGRHHNLLPSVSAMVSAAGRVYCITDEAPVAARGPTDQWRLVARDAFNGLVLWKRPMSDWGWREWSKVETGGLMRFKGPAQLYRRLVADGEVVYVTPGFREPVFAVDGATGKTIRRYRGTENAAEMLCAGKRLFLSRNTPGKPGKDILAVDTDSGRTLWQRGGFVGITARGDELKAYTDTYLTAGAERVLLLDRHAVVALDQATGREVWRAARPEMPENLSGHYQFHFANLCTLVYHDGRVFLGQIRPKATNLNRWQVKDMVVMALDAETGETLWQHAGATLAHFTPPDVFVHSGMVWTLRKDDLALLGRDAATGEPRKQYPVRHMLVGHHHRCYRNKATERLYLAGEEGVEYIDFTTGSLDVHHWLRGACAYGLMPANGLIYLPGHACGCHSNVKLNGFLALASRPDDVVTPRSGGSRPEKGPAYGGVRRPPEPRAPTPGDWPVYRHDNGRSGHAATDAPASLAVLWKTELGGRRTAPVIAAGRVVCAAADCGEVTCLDAATGKVLWRFLPDGPVDTPPSIRDGYVVFGSRGGSVYALRADDGELVWRFRAAPIRRRLVAFGRLESLWPVHGSVLVQDGRVTCLAGRSMHLDGGLFLYALDLATGEVLRQARWQADPAGKGELAGSVLPDLLVADGKGIQMRNVAIDPETLTRRRGRAGGAVLQANDGGLLDSTWLNNTFWRYGPARAQILVFDDTAAYGVSGAEKLISKSYPQDVFSVGSGYRLTAVALSGSSSPGVGRKGGKARKGRSRAKALWSRRIAIRAHALAVTRRHLCLAGAPDVADKTDPWGAFEDRKGGLLAVYTKADGKEVAQLPLPSAPVYDALAAAKGRLFVTLRNGSLLCVGAPTTGTSP